MMNKFFYKLWKTIKKHGPELCTGMAIALVGLSSWETRTATIKAVELKKDAEEIKGSQLTTKERVLVQAPSYIWPLVLDGVTMTLIFTSNYLSRKQQASLLASTVFIADTFNKYRSKIIEKYGEDYDKAVREAIMEDALANIESPSDGLQLFYDELTGDSFESTMEDVVIALSEFERRLCTYGEVSVNEYREYLGLDIRDDCYNIGWNIGCVSGWTGEFWLDYGLDYNEKLNAIQVCLAMPPMVNYDDYDYSSKMIFWPSMVDEDTYLKGIYDKVTREISKCYSEKEVTT